MSSFSLISRDSQKGVWVLSVCLVEFFSRLCGGKKNKLPSCRLMSCNFLG